MRKKLPASLPSAKRCRRKVAAAIGAREKKELAAVAEVLDAAIDTDDMPEVTDWSEARVGQFYRATKNGKRSAP